MQVSSALRRSSEWLSHSSTAPGVCNDAGRSPAAAGNKRLDKVMPAADVGRVAGEHDHRPDRVPEVLEALLGRLGELRVVFGQSATPVVAAVEHELRQAIGARDRGDPVDSVRRIAAAMVRLTDLADGIGGGAGAAMRLVIERFKTALMAGHEGDARRAADVMRDRSGAKSREESGEGSSE